MSIFFVHKMIHDELFRLNYISPRAGRHSHVVEGSPNFSYKVSAQQGLYDFDFLEIKFFNLC